MPFPSNKCSIDLMGRLKHKKVLTKCECGQTVAAGSVFCPHCRAEINRKNAKVIKKAEKKYQKKMGGKGKRNSVNLKSRGVSK